MRSLFLHAGKHKTGTSSFQLYLNEHLEFFKSLGLTIYREKTFRKRLKEQMMTNVFLLANLTVRPELNLGPRLRRKVPRLTFEEQIEACKAANENLQALEGEKILVTSEVFSFLKTPKERQLLDILFAGFDVTPIVVFRNPEDWMKSWAKQMKRLQIKFPEEARKGKGIFNLRPDSWLVDDAKLKTFFSPKGRFLDYDAIMESQGNLIPALLETMGIDPAICPPWDGAWANRSSEKQPRSPKRIKPDPS